MFLSSFVSCFCHDFVNVFVLFLFSFCHVLKLRSFNSQLHSSLSVVGYHARGQDIGKYCPLPEPIRNQIEGFSRYRPLTIKDINKFSYDKPVRAQ